MKKLFCIMTLLLLPMMVFALASSIEVRDDLFKSDQELAKFQTVPLSLKEEKTYEDMEIYLLTGGPGSSIWENFGHAAFVIKVPNRINISVDYGIFTFDESFYGNFILGKLYYEASETYADYRIMSLTEDDRTVELLRLDMTPQEKKNLWEFLSYNTEEENRTYLYDYFVDNCATRLRDIYSWSTG
ncbi:MAG: DUF4105 domain-containing protein, partial [Spirochaetales bacterium]|nr:DUF4105 domain-containing protein [Candidatus Physcosoma equi]